MPQLNIGSSIALGDTITSLQVVDVTGDGKNEIITSTKSGTIHILQWSTENILVEICKIEEIPPVTVLEVGDITGNGKKEIVTGGVDNVLRVVSVTHNAFNIECGCALGSLPTALCVTDVTGDSAAEVIVATDDCALRCFGWYDSLLDKLAHKVVDRPIYSIQPLRGENIPYSKLIFGDDTGYLFLYQYADDRLHERGKIKARGPVDLVATGSILGKKLEEIVAISKKNITIFGQGHSGFEFYDNIRAPNTISAVKIGRIMKTGSSTGQIVVSQENSLLSIFSLDGRRLVEECSAKTKKKARKTHIALGDVNEDNAVEIVQAVDEELFVVMVQ